MTKDYKEMTPEEAASQVYEDLYEYISDPNHTCFGGVQWLLAFIKAQREAAVNDYKERARAQYTLREDNDRTVTILLPEGLEIVYKTHF